MGEPSKYVIDALSIGTVVSTLAGWLPAIAALLTIIWTGIRIFETRTFQRWIGKGRRDEMNDRIERSIFRDGDR